jgi:hypothetical protein
VPAVIRTLLDRTSAACIAPHFLGVLFHPFDGLAIPGTGCLLVRQLPVGHGQKEPVEGVAALAQLHRLFQRRDRRLPIACFRQTEHGSGLGKHRWVVERTLSWLHQFRRLRVRYERRDSIHKALLTLACIVTCSYFL